MLELRKCSSTRSCRIQRRGIRAASVEKKYSHKCLKSVENQAIYTNLLYFTATKCLRLQKQSSEFETQLPDTQNIHHLNTNYLASFSSLSTLFITILINSIQALDTGNRNSVSFPQSRPRSDFTNIVSFDHNDLGYSTEPHHHPSTRLFVL